MSDPQSIALETPDPGPEGSDRPVSLAGLYRALWRHAAGVRHLILWGFLLLLASQLFKLAVPWLAGRAIDTIQRGGIDGLAGAGRWLALVFAAIAASWLLHGPGRILERNVALRVRERLSALLVGRLMAAPLAWHERHHSGETTHRVQQSTHALYDFAQSQFIYLQNTVRLVGPIVALCLISPLVGAVAVAGYGLIGLLITRFDRRMMRLAVDENHAERRYAATVVDVLGNVFSVLALRRGGGAARLVAARLAAAFGPLRRSIVLNEIKWCSVDLLASLLWCVLVGVYAAEAGGLIGGAAVAGGVALGKVFMVYEYAQQAGGVITAIAAHFQSLSRQRADYAAARPLLEAPQVKPVTAASAPEGWRRLLVSGLRLTHAGGRGGLAIDRLGFVRGRRYALVGPSGAGKTTLLRVLAGLDAAGAELRVEGDGREPAVVAGDEAVMALRGWATLIPQQAEMFDGTLRENLAVGEEVAAARVREALHATCAEALVEALPEGLGTRVAEGGANWSGGQRQRLALARGVLAAEGSALVLLDEPTSSLDPESETRVYEGLFSRFGEAAVVSSVHRLHLLDRFDEVILMRDGRVEAVGSAWALAQGSPLFRELLAAQAGQSAAVVPEQGSGAT